MQRWLQPDRLPIVLFALAAAAWLPSLWCGFVFDDVYLIEQQTCFHSLSNIPDFFVDPYDACDYRPMRYVTYAIDYAIAGNSPWIYHLTNVLFHAGSTVLLWFIVRRLFARGGGEAGALAAVCVALWAVHPALADAVVPAAGRRDVQCTFFYLLSLVLILERDRGPRWAFLGGAALSFAAALLTKEMAVTAPAVAVLLELGARREPLSARARKTLWALACTGLLVAALFTFYRAVHHSHSNMAGRWWGGSPWTNFLTVLGLQAEYARITFFPASLVGDYSLFTVPVEREITARVVVGAGLVVAAVTTMVVTWRRAPLVAVGIGWYGLAMSPVSHIFPHHELMAEHYLHLPMAGLAVAASGIKLNRHVRGLILVVLLALVARQQVRVLDYRSDETFGWHVAREAPRNVRNLGRLSSFYLETGNIELGTRLAWLQLRTAAPGSLAEADAARRVAHAVERWGKDPVTSAELLRFVAQHNDDRALRRELARTLVALGQCQAALPILGRLVDERAAAIDVASLGVCALMEGRLSEAASRADASLKLAPTADGYFLRANVALEQGRVPAAMRDYDRVLALDASHVDALRVSAGVLCPVDRDAARARLHRAARVVPADRDQLLSICP